MNHMLDPQKTSHTSPWRANYGVICVNICEKYWMRYNGTALYILNHLLPISLRYISKILLCRALFWFGTTSPYILVDYFIGAVAIIRLCQRSNLEKYGYICHVSPQELMSYPQQSKSQQNKSQENHVHI